MSPIFPFILASPLFSTLLPSSLRSPLFSPLLPPLSILTDSPLSYLISHLIFLLFPPRLPYFPLFSCIAPFPSSSPSTSHFSASFPSSPSLLYYFLLFSHLSPSSSPLFYYFLLFSPLPPPLPSSLLFPPPLPSFPILFNSSLLYPPLLPSFSSSLLFPLLPLIFPLPLLLYSFLLFSHFPSLENREMSGNWLWKWHVCKKKDNILAISMIFVYTKI